MVWVIQTPTPEEGAQLTGMTPAAWQEAFDLAYWRESWIRLDTLGVDVRQLPPPPSNWGIALVQLAEALEAGGGFIPALAPGCPFEWHVDGSEGSE